MKKLFSTHQRSIALLFLSFVSFVSCSTEKQEGEIVKIDLSKNFPEKQIDLTEIADISCIRFDPGENDEYLFRGSSSYISEQVIVICDFQGGLFISLLLMGHRFPNLTGWDKGLKNIII